MPGIGPPSDMKSNKEACRRCYPERRLVNVFANCFVSANNSGRRGR
jgi:hypothetical protein